MTTTTAPLGRALSAPHQAVARETALAAVEAGRLRQLVAAHHDFLWRGLRRLGVPAAEIDDALQTVFVIASQKLSAIVPETERAYLFAIGVRVASNARRTEARKRRVFDTEPIDEAAAAAVAIHDPVEMRDLLEHALEPMSLELRTVFVLFEFEEMTAPEIAAFIGVPVGTVSSRLRRARELFSQRAEELRLSLQDGEEG